MVISSVSQKSPLLNTSNSIDYPWSSPFFYS